MKDSHFHERWMKAALTQASSTLPFDEVPVGAVLICDGKIIGEGANRRETTQRTVAHAEIIALESYSKSARSWRVPPGTSLYVTVEPCLMCTGALLWARV